MSHIEKLNHHNEHSPPLIKIDLPGAPHQIATSCDGKFLAVDVDVNGTPLLFIYTVETLLTGVR